VTAIAADGREVGVGRVGELHPRLLDAYEVRAGHVAFAEIDLDVLLGLAPLRTRAGRLERVPGIERDVAIVVAAEQAAGEVEAVIRESGGEALRDVRLVDIYVGPPVEAGHKSLAYRLRFEPVEAVAADEDVGAAMERVVAVLSERLGARLRA
jgi:phenylalanyl-tRNA synthetase beta chain